MALTFSGDDGIKSTTAPVTTLPLTMACWFYVASFYQNFIPLLSISDSAHSSDSQTRLIVNNDGGFKVAANSWSTDGYHRASSTATPSTATWQHAAGVWSANNARAAYLNGGNKGTNSNTNNNAMVAQEFNNGYNPWSGQNPGDDSWLIGSIAEIAVWNVALTDAEIAVLGKGYSPLFVRPASLKYYIPGVRDFQDIIGNKTLTEVSDVTASAHPSIINKSFYTVTTPDSAVTTSVKDIIGMGFIPFAR